MFDPRKHRLSPNFVLSDFLGNHSVYSKGLKNELIPTEPAFLDMRLANVEALCVNALEPIMAEYGGCSISYGFISDAVSKEIVKYQDPMKPSHHRFDLGAAADVIFHDWVNEEFVTLDDMYVHPSAAGSPIMLAHGIHNMGIPYSRMITYSESPCICLAVSAVEVVRETPRKAFYENRYTGQPKVKPDYRQYASDNAKNRAFEDLQDNGLAHDWRGDGFPSHHCGGFQQYQHMRVSKRTMVSDFLFDLKSISNGCKNIPSLNLDTVQDSFAAAGIAYDWLATELGSPRLSVVRGYVSHLNPHCEKGLMSGNDWRQELISFAVNEELDLAGQDWANYVTSKAPNGIFLDFDEEGFLEVNIDVNMVLEGHA